MLRVEVDGDDAEQVAAADVSTRHAFCKEQKARRLATPLSLSLALVIDVYGFVCR